MLILKKALIPILASVAMAILASFVPASAAAPVILNERALIDSAKTLIAKQQYRLCRELLVRIQSRNPANIEVLYLRLMVRQTEILDYESYTFTLQNRDFLLFADSVQNTITQRIRSLHGRDSIDALYYLATTNGARAIMLAKNNNWIAAINCAYQSVPLLKSVLEHNPNYGPAYLGMGIFNYYCTKNLKWIPLFGDRTGLGLRQVRRACDSPLPYNLGAKNTLCWILIEQGKYREAEAICNQVLAQYPGNTIFLRIAVSISCWTKNWPKALLQSQQLIELTRVRTPINWSDLLTACDIKIESLYNLKRNTECSAMIRTVQQFIIPGDHRKIPYVQKHLDHIRSFAPLCAQNGNSR